MAVKSYDLAMRRAGAAIICACLMAVFAPSALAADETAPVQPPAVHECNDGIDNDGDGDIDLGPTDDPSTDDFESDDGCKDRSPLTEHLTSVSELTNVQARGYARDAAKRTFHRDPRNAVAEKLTCHRKSRTRRQCELVYFAAGFFYAARITIWNDVNSDDDQEWWFYRLRGWKMSYSCGQRDDPFKCASKRYLVR